MFFLLFEHCYRSLVRSALEVHCWPLADFLVGLIYCEEISSIVPHEFQGCKKYRSMVVKNIHETKHWIHVWIQNWMTCKQWHPEILVLFEIWTSKDWKLLDAYKSISYWYPPILDYFELLINFVATYKNNFYLFNYVLGHFLSPCYTLCGCDKQLPLV